MRGRWRILDLPPSRWQRPKVSTPTQARSPRASTRAAEANSGMTDASNFRLVGITLDEGSLVRRTREIEQEREIAIYDLLEANSFAPIGSGGGPYQLVLAIEE